MKEKTFTDTTTAVTTKSTQTELATQQNQVDVDPSILEAIATTPPRFKLLQSNSDEVTINGERSGTYYNNLMMESYGTEMKVIPLKLTRGALYIKQGERKVTCRSADGVTSMNGDLCAECPYGVYHLNKWRDGKSPDCKTTIALLSLEAESLTPGVMYFQKAAFKTGETLAKQLALSRRPVAVTLKSTQEKNDKGIFNVPVVSGLTPLTQEQYAAQTVWKDRLSGVTVGTTDVED